MQDNEALAREWLSWFNSGRFAAPERVYAPEVELQRAGIQGRLTGRDVVVEFLREECERRQGRELRPVHSLVDGDSIAIEADCQGFDAALQRFDSPDVRLGPTLIFLTLKDGRIVQDHTYVAAAPQRLPPLGLDELEWQPSRQPMPPLLELWEHLYRVDPVRMMTDCYTADATVTAMRIGWKPTPRADQIAIEQRSAAAFPGRRLSVRRWLARDDAMAVELTWEGHHRRDPERSLRTVSACFLRLREGRIARDHTYVPTGLA